MSELERERNLSLGRIRFLAQIETPGALQRLAAIASAHPRMVAMQPVRPPIKGSAIAGESQDLLGAPHHWRINHFAVQQEGRQSKRGGIVFRATTRWAHSSSCALGEKASLNMATCVRWIAKAPAKPSRRACAAASRSLCVGELADAPYEAQREQPGRTGGKQNRKVWRQ
ncbi:hypothetical protein [Mesorhizobium sp. M0843]|uniref:hypothetical protein n=1 Tax=Mesorhizobium sp. M0843 TaxID=2957010 RepID=UPI0033361BF5